MLLADRVRSLGYGNATKAGISICLDDMVIPKAKEELLDRATGEVDEIQTQYAEGLITDGERYNKVIDIWAQVTEEVAEEMMGEIGAEIADGTVPRRARRRSASSRPSTPSSSWPTPAPAAPRSRSVSWPACEA